MCIEIVAMARMPPPEPFRHQLFDRLSDQVPAFVAEHLQGTRIRLADRPPRVGHKDRVGTDGKMILDQNLGELSTILPRLRRRILLRGI